MDKIHLHYTQTSARLFAVSAHGLSVKQLTHYARNAGFLFVTAPRETQLLIGNHTIQKFRLFRTLENAGYAVTVTTGTRDIFPPMPLLDASYFEEEAEILADLNYLAEDDFESDEAHESDRYSSRFYNEGDAS